MRNNIEDVVSTYVHLERSGRDLKGLCPFHSEKTPSFVVHPSDGYFHCFGCGAGGDVITFIMRAENLSYPDALQFLAQRVGITLPDSGEKRDGTLSKTEVVKMNREAAKFYHACLMDPKTPAGLQYLHSRGLSDALIKHFGLGYAPDGWSALRDHLASKGFSYEQMVTANLVQESRNKKGTFYDVFRNRVMVPMLDVSGSVVAFSGRRFDGVNMMKYVNTADTPAFRKGKYIFALNFAKDHCAERLILCEGQMDVIALHGAGFPQAIATMGTAITPEQARIMKRYTKSVVICYDDDAAGQKADDKAFALLSEVGLETRILKVQNAKDPDEFIRKFGKEAFARLLDGTKTQFEHKFAQILSKYDVRNTDEKVKAANETVRLIAGFYSSVERELYIQNASAKLELPGDSLKSDVERILRSERRKQKKDESARILRQTEGYGDRVNMQFAGNVSAARSEEAILGMMLLRPEIAKETFEKGAVRENDFVTDFDRRVFLSLKEQYEKHGALDPGLLAESFTTDEVARVFRMRSERAELSENSIAVFTDCVKKLRASGKTEATEDGILSIIKKKREKG